MKLMIKPPEAFASFPAFQRSKSVFLAGTIDMGDSYDWQQDVFDSMVIPYSGEDFIVLNPRRDDWDSSVEQKITDPTFYQQVTWEQDALRAVDLIAFNFLPESQSVVTMLELGQAVEKQWWDDTAPEVIVCCPDGFWRQGNVHKLCEDYEIPMFTDYENFKREINIRLRT